MRLCRWLGLRYRPGPFRWDRGWHSAPPKTICRRRRPVPAYYASVTPRLEVGNTMGHPANPGTVRRTRIRGAYLDALSATKGAGKLYSRLLFARSASRGQTASDVVDEGGAGADALSVSAVIAVSIYALSISVGCASSPTRCNQHGSRTPHAQRKACCRGVEGVEKKTESSLQLGAPSNFATGRELGQARCLEGRIGQS